MGKKYYGGIGTDKGFVMYSPESKYHYSCDDELDDFFGDLLSIKACIALAIEGLFKALMSRSCCSSACA